VFPCVGALILSRLPGNRLGWLYCLCGLACALTLAFYGYAQRGLVARPGTMPAAVATAWVSSWVWMCGFGPLMTFGVLGFPDGRLPGRRWWPVAALPALTIGGGVLAIALRPGPLENHPVRDNPFGVPAFGGRLESLLDSWWLPLLLASIVLCFAALVSRYRSASSGEKERYRWFVIAVGMLIVSFAIPADSAVGPVGNLLLIVAVPLFPLSIAVAVLRTRLDGFDVAVRRSLIYGWLLAVLLALYAAVVLVFDALLRNHAQPVVALLGAGVVAVLYQPLRLRLQAATDRMLYGERRSPYAVSTGVTRSLQDAGSAEQALRATVAGIAQALRLPSVAVELPGDTPQRPTAAYGASSSIDPLCIPLKYGDEQVGRLVVGRRDSRERLGAAERELLEDLARQVAVAAHAALLDRALRRSLERLIEVRADERVRLRRDLHDGLGPALAGVALGLDAARNMVPTDKNAADDLLCDLKNETLGCVAEVRRIIDNLRPTTLDELGLLPALQDFADRLSSRDGQVRVSVEFNYAPPHLPQAVEAAAYRIATEAMTNVARHAQASNCVLRLQFAEDLTVEVQDDGIGLAADQPPGVGLPSMAQRARELGGECEVARIPGGGTRVLAHLPLTTA
jgi:signal transduction histidine kinase